MLAPHRPRQLVIAVGQGGSWAVWRSFDPSSSRRRTRRCLSRSGWGRCPPEPPTLESVGPLNAASPIATQLPLYGDLAPRDSRGLSPGAFSRLADRAAGRGTIHPWVGASITNTHSGLRMTAMPDSLTAVTICDSRQSHCSVASSGCPRPITICLSAGVPPVSQRASLTLKTFTALLCAGAAISR